MKRHYNVVVGLSLMALGACSSPSGNGYPVAGQTASSQPETHGTGDFCAVQTLLEASCQSCHANPPATGVPMPLMTYDDLLASAPTDASVRVVDLSIVRMQDSRAPMPPPPAPRASADEVAVLSNWVNQGMPATCDTGTALPDNIFDTPLTCSSGSYRRGEEESPNMKPGGACISCHTSSREGPRYQIAGTVYPTAHEPDDCIGVDGTTGNAQVVVTDATGAEIVLDVNSVGNFYSRESIVLPYKAKVVQNGQERVMQTAQQSGDCNGCHTESGSNQAPGRIMLP